MRFFSSPVALLLLFLSAATAAGEVVYYPVEAGRRIEGEIPLQVLKLALQKHGGDWDLQPSPLGPMNEQRSKILLSHGQGLDIAWYGTYPELEKQLMPVRIPINGGLLGWRLFLIDGRRQAEFSRIENQEDLTRLNLVQGQGWGDIKVLEDAGFPVTAAEYHLLFGLVTAGRADAFPRGVDEIYVEHAQWSEHLPNLAIEQSLAIYYPWMKLFFVQNGNHALHDAIFDGLQKAHADGSYQELFFSHPSNRKTLDLGRLHERRLFHLDNAHMTDETRNIDPKFFFKADKNRF
ncbi:hypothetical protein [Roseibium sp.]|uniref:hypothetical protein n=1 Tax=Roseibium sp. TaxID=1936156 RepID=UPI003D11AE3D